MSARGSVDSWRPGEARWKYVFTQQDPTGVSRTEYGQKLLALRRLSSSIRTSSPTWQL